MRSTHSHTGQRRSHHALRPPVLRACSDCGLMKLSHSACLNCGKYKGRVVIDVSARLAKEERKRKQKSQANK